jgi:hypothetical protein
LTRSLSEYCLSDAGFEEWGGRRYHVTQFGEISA